MSLLFVVLVWRDDDDQFVGCDELLCIGFWQADLEAWLEVIGGADDEEDDQEEADVYERNGV